MLIRQVLVNMKFNQQLDDFKPHQHEELRQCSLSRKELILELFQRTTYKTFCQKKLREQVLINQSCLMQADDGRFQEMNDFEDLKDQQI